MNRPLAGFMVLLCLLDVLDKLNPLFTESMCCLDVPNRVLGKGVRD